VQSDSLGDEVFEDVGMMWCSAEKKRALVCRWFLARVAKGTPPSRRLHGHVSCNHREEKTLKTLVFFSEKK